MTEQKEIWPKRLYRGVIDLIAFVVGHTSDQGADVAIRALPILVPLPNAISMYFVSKTVLGFTHEQALAFAAAIECAMFGLIEVSLHMFDGYLKDRRRYQWPFYISLSVVGLVTAIIIVLVYKLEVGASGHTILALLPVMSCASAVGLGLKRWHNRNENQTQTELEAKLFDAEGSMVRLQNQIVELKAEIQNQLGYASGLEQGLNAANQTNQVLQSQIDGLTERVEFWKQQTETRSTGVLEPQKTSSKQGSTQDRRLAVLRAISQTAKRSDVNFTELGVEHGVSDTAIKKDVEWLVVQEYWINGDTWKPTPKGIDWAGLVVNAN
jgi:hypothetical protein